MAKNQICLANLVFIFYILLQGVLFLYFQLRNKFRCYRTRPNLQNYTEWYKYEVFSCHDNLQSTITLSTNIVYIFFTSTLNNI